MVAYSYTGNYKNITFVNILVIYSHYVPGKTFLMGGATFFWPPPVYIKITLITIINNNYLVIIFKFVDTPRNFIIAKLSIRKPGSSSVLIKSDLF